MFTIWGHLYHWIKNLNQNVKSEAIDMKVLEGILKQFFMISIIPAYTKLRVISTLLNQREIR